MRGFEILKERLMNLFRTEFGTLLPRTGLFFLMGTLVFTATQAANQSKGQDSAPQNQVAEYNAEVPKSIVQLQQFRLTTSISIKSKDGREGRATLINLNPNVNAWYALELAWNDGATESFHLENPKPGSRRVALEGNYPVGIVLLEQSNRYACPLFESGHGNPLEQAHGSDLIYAPLCQERLYLRNRAKGHRTTLEAAAEFLRNQVWGGEKVVVLLHHLLEDTHRESGELRTGGPGEAGSGSAHEQSGLPLPGSVDSKYADRTLVSHELGIPVDRAGSSGLVPGAWYPASGNQGIYVSLMEPSLISRQILEGQRTAVNPLDSVESSSLCYLVAFDLGQFDLAYALGTDYPGVGWSEHIQPQMRNPSLPGPDGIGNILPLVSTGLISPQDTGNTVGVFIGGFKREHGAFKSGEFALKNHGTHYGFIQDGVVFSKLQPGLATIFVLDDGSVQMKTWEEGDNRLLGKVKYARQNGVPLVEIDPATRAPVPGRLVSRWGPGNWSGSEEMKLRTIRSGAALQQSGGRRFLIYAVFSDATPSAMARVFQSYQCQYAMLLDMNALEHTYMALYRRSGSQLFLDHLLTGMAQVEKSSTGEVVPRFLGYPDNRDFFYLTRRKK